MSTSLYDYCKVSGKTDLLNDWHADKNGDLTPHTITYGSGKKVWWRCIHDHEWLAIISNRVKGNGCPYCAGRLPVSGQSDLATISPTIAKQWHPTKNSDLTPQDVTPHSNKKVWWRCEKGHEWSATVTARSKGDGCAVCAGKQVMKGANDLATLYPIIARQWHPIKNGELFPDAITANSGKKYGGSVKRAMSGRLPLLCV